MYVSGYTCTLILTPHHSSYRRIRGHMAGLLKKLLIRGEHLHCTYKQHVQMYMHMAVCDMMCVNQPLD